MATRCSLRWLIRDHRLRVDSPIAESSVGCRPDAGPGTSRSWATRTSSRAFRGCSASLRRSSPRFWAIGATPGCSAEARSGALESVQRSSCYLRMEGQGHSVPSGEDLPSRRWDIPISNRGIHPIRYWAIRRVRQTIDARVPFSVLSSDEPFRTSFARSPARRALLGLVGLSPGDVLRRAASCSVGDAPAGDSEVTETAPEEVIFFHVYYKGEADLRRMARGRWICSNRPITKAGWVGALLDRAQYDDLLAKGYRVDVVRRETIVPRREGQRPVSPATRAIAPWKRPTRR